MTTSHRTHSQEMQQKYHRRKAYRNRVSYAQHKETLRLKYKAFKLVAWKIMAEYDMQDHPWFDDPITIAYGVPWEFDSGPGIDPTPYRRRIEAVAYRLGITVNGGLDWIVKNIRGPFAEEMRWFWISTLEEIFMAADTARQGDLQ